MKVCITAKGPTLESQFEQHFARAPYFIFYDTRTSAVDVVRNGFIISDTKIGRNAVRLLKMNGLETVITGKIGENACDLLIGAGIKIRMCNSKGTAKEALEATLLHEHNQTEST